MYKQASKLKLRFETSKGSLSIEQLWDLSLNQLSVIVRNLKKKLKEVEGDDDLAFLDNEVTKIDEVVQLQFNIVKDIYIDKKGEIEAQKNEAVKKQEEQYLLSILKEHEDEVLRKDPELVKKKLAELQG